MRPVLLCKGMKRRSPAGKLRLFVVRLAAATIGAVLAVSVECGATPPASTPAPPARAPEPLVDPAVRLLQGSAAGEAYDVLARLDDGSTFSVRFWVTNEGPGTHTAVAMGYFVRPDGDVSRFRYGRTSDRWELGEGKRLLKIASAVLDLRAPLGAVEIDTDKFGMKISMRFAMPEVPGAICARREEDAGFDVLRLQEKVMGTAWVDGMDAALEASGTVDVVHRWGEASEIDSVLRRIDASASSGELVYFATTVVSPRDRDSAHSCVAVVENGERVYQAFDAAVQVASTPLPGSEERYPLAKRFEFRNQRVGLTVEPFAELLRVDPLEIVPQPFRFLLGLRSSPRRVWANARSHLRLTPAEGREPVELRALGLTAVSYTNPW